MLCLGFPVSVLGRPRLKAHDGRRWEQAPHLSVSLLYVRDIFEYLHEAGICLYRLSPHLAPYLNHPDHPQFHRQLDECAESLAYVGELALRYSIRLSIHATPYTSLSTPNEGAAQRSQCELAGWVGLLDRLGAGPEGRVVLHVGGAYGERQESMRRFVQRCQALPAAVRGRLALEHDDHLYSLADALGLAGQTGLPVVWDYLHFVNHNPEGLGMAEALSLALHTWPAGVPPKLHFCSPRTELRRRPNAEGAVVLEPMRWSEHADFVNPFEFIACARLLPAGSRVDIMLEARAKDLAVLRLRADLARFAPDLVVDAGKDGRERGGTHGKPG